jgi:hypothetical protein
LFCNSFFERVVIVKAYTEIIEVKSDIDGRAIKPKSWKIPDFAPGEDDDLGFFRVDGDGPLLTVLTGAIKSALKILLILCKNHCVVCIKQDVQRHKQIYILPHTV